MKEEEEVIQTGRWWEFWADEEVFKAAESLGYSKEEVEAALEELKSVYTPEWLRNNYPEHPLLPWMLHPGGIGPIIEFLEIGRNIHVLGGVNSLPRNTKKGLAAKVVDRNGRASLSIYGRIYEIVVWAYLKERGNHEGFKFILEHHITDTNQAKPDGKIVFMDGKEIFVQIHRLTTSKRKSNHTMNLSMINRDIKNQMKTKDGAWIYEVNLKTLEQSDLDKAPKVAEKILKENDPPFNMQKEMVQIKIEKQNSYHGSQITTLNSEIEIEIKGASQVHTAGIISSGGENLLTKEYDRIAELLAKLCESVSKGELLIVVIKVDEPMIIIMPHESLKKFVDLVFNRANEINSNIMRIMQIWIDVTVHSKKKGDLKFYIFHNPYHCIS